MDIKQKIQELSLDQKAKLYFMGLVRKGEIDTLPEDPKAAYVRMMMDKDDYGRSVSGKDKRTFMDPEDSMPAARFRKMAGMDEMQMVNKETGEDVTKYVLQLLQGKITKQEFEKITGLKKEVSLEEGYNAVAKELYGVNYDELSPREQEYVRDTIDLKPGGAFNPSGKKASFEEMATELGYLNESIGVNLKDLTFDMVTKVFKDEYESKDFVAIAFPKEDDTLLRVRNESDFNNWKANTMERFGNVQVRLKPEADVWFDKVTIMDDEFKAAQDKSDAAKQSFIDSEREAGRSID